MNLAARFDDYMIALRGGAIIRHGPPEAVITPEVLRETFNIAAEVVKEPHTKRPVCVFYNVMPSNAPRDT